MKSFKELLNESKKEVTDEEFLKLLKIRPGSADEDEFWSLGDGGASEEEMKDGANKFLKKLGSKIKVKKCRIGDDCCYWEIEK